MKAELLNELMQISEEERAVLDQKKEVVKELYTNQANSSLKVTNSSEKTK
jgi:hypothetical protein